MRVWRKGCTLLLCFSCCPAFAQSSLWKHFSGLTPEQPAPADLGEVRVAALKALIASSRTNGKPDCEPDHQTDQRLSFFRLPVAARPVTWVWRSCNPQDNDPAEYLFAWASSRPLLIGGPRGLWCWFNHVEPHSVNGFHDFTMGCHRSAFSTDFAWYRFDGKRYRRISTATGFIDDESGRPDMEAVRASCREAHKPCNLLLYKHPD